MNKKQTFIAATVVSVIVSLVVSSANFSYYQNSLDYEASLLTRGNQLNPKKFRKKSSVSRNSLIEEAMRKAAEEDVDVIEPYTMSVKKVRKNGLEIEVPEVLFDLYKGTELRKSVSDTTEEINKLIKEGKKLTDTQAEEMLRGLFSEAVVDTGTFADSLLQRYNLSSIGRTFLKNKKASKELKKAVKQEIEDYAKREVNKLANQAVSYFIPQLSGVNIDFTNLNKKTLKSTMRSAAVNALAQSYLGPQYIAFYMAFETLFPNEAEKVHKELRRFDKKYLTPLAHKIEDEVDRAVDKLEAEWKRTKEKIEAEAKRFEKKAKAEGKRLERRVRKWRKKVF